MSNIGIIGGGHSSGKLTQHLINGNFKGNIKIFSEEDSPPYERPPLSKEYLEDGVKFSYKGINKFVSNIYKNISYLNATKDNSMFAIQVKNDII